MDRTTLVPLGAECAVKSDSVVVLERKRSCLLVAAREGLPVADTVPAFGRGVRCLAVLSGTVGL